jgi:hypothetical protein
MLVYQNNLKNPRKTFITSNPQPSSHLIPPGIPTTLLKKHPKISS